MRALRQGARLPASAGAARRAQAPLRARAGRGEGPQPTPLRLPPCQATTPHCFLVCCSVPEVDSVFFNMPNLHFNPVAPVTSSFNHDIYVRGAGAAPPFASLCFIPLLTVCART